MRMFIRLEARDALFRREDVEVARKAFGETMEKIMGSGKVEASGFFADGRGGIFIMEIESAVEMAEYVLTVIDYATVETHPLMTAEAQQEFFERLAQ